MPTPVDGGGSDASRTDGSTADGGTGDGGGDPCAGLTLCTTTGTSCEGDGLVTCAEDANGCLVETTEDCGLAEEVCDDTSGTAACVDPCSLIPAEDRCDVEGRVCNGDTLEICAMDAEGCLVLATTDCATMDPVAVCDDTGAMPMCAMPDPCEGVTQCGTAESRACSDSDTITVCAADAAGCFVETTMDCTGGQICDGATTTCVDPCAGLTICPSATYCDASGELVTCAPNANGCLVETTREACGTGTTCAAPTGMAPACRDTQCPEAVPTVIDCATGTVTGDTAMGSAIRTNYAPCTTLTSYAGREQIFVFRNAQAARVTIDSTRTGTSTGDFDLFAVDAGDGSATCGSSTLLCDDSSTGTGATESITFDTTAGDTKYIVFDRYSSTTDTSPFELDITCVVPVCADGTREAFEGCDDGNTTAGDGCSPTCTVETGYACTGTMPSVCALACGNGTVNSGEGCDDGNTTAGDGCSATCTVEPNYACTGTMPSTCVPAAANSTCATATAVTGTTTLTSQDPRIGGPLPTGTGCSRGTATTGLYYSVSIPANTRVTVAANPTSTFVDLVVRALDACDGACTANVDSGNPETVHLVNDTAATVTRIIVVSAYGTGGNPADVTFTYTPIAANAVCSGATPLTGTLTGESLSAGGPAPTGTSCGTSAGPVRYYSVAIPANTLATVVGTSTGTPSWDLTLRTLAGCDGTCLSNRDSSSSSAETVTLVNDTGSPVTRLVAVGADSTRTWSTYDLAVTFTALPTNTTCAAARSITADASFTGELGEYGGPRPMGAGCGTTTGDDALYYSVSIPAGAAVSVVTAGTLNRVLLFQDSCGATSCSFATDTSPERGLLTNTTASTITQIVAVSKSSTSSTGTYDISFTYQTCGNGVAEGTETCDDGGTTAGDGCSATCSVDPGYECTGAPSVCTLTYTAATIPAACVTTGTFTSIPRLSSTSNDTTTAITALPFTATFFDQPVTHYSAGTDGFVQLWTSATGTPSGDFTNDAIPNASTPNGMIAAFWDDIYLGSAYDIRTQTVGTAGSQTFVIEWRDALAGSGGSPLTFQVHIAEGTGVIELHYCSVGTSARAGGDSATIGLENATGTAGLQTSYNTAGTVMTGSGFRYTPAP